MFSITSAKGVLHIALWAVFYNTLPAWPIGIFGMVVGLPLLASLLASSILFIGFFFGIMYYIMVKDNQQKQALAEQQRITQHRRMERMNEQ